MITLLILQQYQALLATPGLSREECEARFPELIAYILAQVSLVDLLRGEGFELKSLSPDAPGVFVAQGACPNCRGDIVVKEHP